MGDETGFTPEMTKAFVSKIYPRIPMEDYDAALHLEPCFRREWVRFLWRYRRRSNFLLRFFSFGPDFADELSRDYVKTKIQQALSWIETAKKDFLESRISFFWNCRILNYRDRPKHWRPATFSRQRVQMESYKNKEGIFVPGMPTILLSQGLWGIFEAHFDRVRRRRLRFASFDFGIDVGYSMGEATSIVRYDINYTAVHAHAYPISKQEADRDPLVTLDDVNFELRRSA